MAIFYDKSFKYLLYLSCRLSYIVIVMFAWLSNEGEFHRLLKSFVKLVLKEKELSFII